jgi:protein-S-isoprenylcysteine O-methyltransferase Ste14
LLRKERRGEGLQSSMSNDVAHTRWWQIFEVVFGIPFLVAIALPWVAPLPLPHGFLRPVLVPAGVVLIIAGGSLVVLARQELTRYGQPTDPGHPTRKIISTGVFSVSRNPLYLGGIFMLAGISFACHLPWVFVLLIPSIVACQYLLVVPEERYLAAKFGEQYRQYTASVNRWIGRTHRSS